MARPIDKTLSPAAAAANNICLAQTTAGAANLLLNGAIAGSLDYASILSFYSAGNISTVTFTITGTDAEGGAITDTVTGINASTVKGTKYFLVVTSIAASGAVGTNVTVGTTGRALVSRLSGINTYSPDPYRAELIITGTATVTLQETFDEISSITSSSLNWYDVAGLDSVTTTNHAQGSPGATAVRVQVVSTSSTPTINYRIIESHRAIS